MIIVLILGYFFVIRLPLHRLLLLKKYPEKKILLNINEKADKKSLPHLNVDMPTFLSLLVSKAKKNSLQLKSIAPLSITYRNKFKIEPVAIALNGNYFDLIKFITIITQLPYIILFSKIELTKSQQQINLQMEIEVYHN